MENFFDKSLHFLGKTNNTITALNIGSMDGVMFDEMIGYTNMYNFNVLYVEPIPYLFDRLKSNIGDVGLFENSAISDYDGEIEMMTIDKEVIDSGLIHSCFYGMSAVYPPKNGLGSEGDRLTVEKYGKLVKVPCITFDTLMDKHKLNNFDILKVDAEGHDFKIFKQIDFKKYTPKVIRLEWINLSEQEQSEIIEIFKTNDFIYEISGQDIVGLPKYFYDEIFSSSKPKNNIIKKTVNTQNNVITIVTGLWDIGRGELQEGWSRSYQHYLDKFQQLLQVDVNMIIFGDEELEKFVLDNRRNENTQFVRRDLSWFKNNEFYDKIQKIRTNPDWYNQVGWLTDSTQAKLEMYNPLVMSKIYLLHDAKILDKFDSEYMFWIDAGLTNTIHPGYFTHDKVLDKLPKLVNNFHFVCFPYETNSEIHGFKYQELCDLVGKPVNMVARAGFFGGKKDAITEINGIYYGLMNDTLSQGLMGTEESLFTIMTYKYPNLITYSEIEGNGLMGKFFEDLKNMAVEVKSEVSKDVAVNNLNTSKVGLYVITFNSPSQFETLIKSMLEYDKDFIDKPRKFLLDNSTDLSTTPRYLELCEEYGFDHIKKDNIGIVGGRVFVSEHFDETDLDFYYFFEDDMAFHPKKGEVCRNGFPRFVDNLYQKSLEIIQKENFDFLKLNFTEFFGDHSVQWSWYNVGQDFRQKHWPNNTKLPVQGLDPNSPKTKFDEIHIHKGLPYITGESHLSNWPIVLTKEGNYKCYLETKWAHPYEQTLMSYSYQETVKGKIKPGLLLLTPTEHHRFQHYDGSLRKES
jgi:FkbM family methyltransferase